ncbi:MAG TPA: sulfotransferase domain-containing protein [Vicinamibacterales bacterium]|nr:sulfotransferase domain-containing protein [Vicinamibacterales bacterium]
MSDVLTINDCISADLLPGLAWLAGYPRSGAALIRTILVHCFGHATGSSYDESMLGEPYCEAVRLVAWPLSLGKFRDILLGQGTLFVKTHELPEPGLPGIPTIVIVRDGRRTLESLKAFYLECNAVEVTWPAMVAGQHIWGSWSDWVGGWAVAGPADALWLRYEDVMADTRGTVDRIARRFGIEPVGYEIPPFDSLQRGSPGIFRGCAVEGNGGMSPEVEEEFWRLHGGAMTMLGYHRD